MTHQLIYVCVGGDGGGVDDRSTCHSAQSLPECSLDRWTRLPNRSTIFFASFRLSNWLGNDLLAPIDCHGLPILKPHFPLFLLLCRSDRHLVVVKKSRGVVVVVAAAAAADCYVDAVVVLAADSVS